MMIMACIQFPDYWRRQFVRFVAEKSNENNKIFTTLLNKVYGYLITNEIINTQKSRLNLTFTSG